MSNQTKRWFVIDFANVNLEDAKELESFINQWTPKENPPHTAPEWFYIITMAIEARKAGAEEHDLLPLLFNNRNIFNKYQDEIRCYLKNFKKTALYNTNNQENKDVKGRILTERILTDDLIKDLCKKLSNIRLTVKTIPVVGSSLYLTTQVIVPDLTGFEDCLFYDFYQYVTANSTLLICAECGNYISNPNKSQFSNARRGLATLHATESCRDAYIRKKDTEKKRNKYIASKKGRE